MAFEATWQSLGQMTIPTWYQDAKFGIFIHWGLYSVPAFDNEWYSRSMYLQGSAAFKHHVETFGTQDKFGYKDFIPMFTAEKFDAAQWADLFKEAGARYVVPVAEHHDGFAMYDSALSDWTAAKMGPKRDLIGEIAAAVRKAGLVFGYSNHRAEHWWFMNGGRQFPSDVQDPAYQDFYGPATLCADSFPGGDWNNKDWQPRPDGKFMEDWMARNCELVDKYQPQVIYFDWWIEQVVFAPYLQRFAAYYYNSEQAQKNGVVLNYKLDSFPEGTAVWDVERGQLKDLRPVFWQTDTAVAKNSWGYTTQQEYKTATSILHDLIDIVSKNGTLQLNIGPRADGTIPEAEQAMLREIGGWLKVNGEAIYGSRPWKQYGEGPTEVVAGSFQDTKREAFTAQDIRFTVQGETLYAMALGWPENGEVAIKALGTNSHFEPIRRVELLGSEGLVTWSQGAEVLKVSLPAGATPSPALTLKIT